MIKRYINLQLLTCRANLVEKKHILFPFQIKMTHLAKTTVTNFYGS